jgi:hypothetical protein
VLILAIADDTLKNTNGTKDINNRFKNKSPNGFNIVALGPSIAPTTPPISIAPNSNNDDL